MFLAANTYVSIPEDATAIFEMAANWLSPQNSPLLTFLDFVEILPPWDTKIQWASFWGKESRLIMQGKKAIDGRSPEMLVDDLHRQYFEALESMDESSVEDWKMLRQTRQVIVLIEVLNRRSASPLHDLSEVEDERKND